MKSKYTFALIVLIACFGCKNEALFLLNEVKPVILTKNGEEIFQYWEFQNKSNLREFKLGDIKGIYLYRDSLKNSLGETNYKKAILKQSTVDSSVNKILKDDTGDVINYKLVHDGSQGKIRRINFIEAELLNYQISKYPLFSHPTEFIAYFIVQDSLDLFRIYFCSSDQPWPPKHQPLFDAIEIDLENGWKMETILHNHFEPDSNNYIGILAPSMSDAQFFKALNERYDLESAIITNGFHTVDIKKKEFTEFESY